MTGPAQAPARHVFAASVVPSGGPDTDAPSDDACGSSVRLWPECGISAVGVGHAAQNAAGARRLGRVGVGLDFGPRAAQASGMNVKPFAHPLVPDAGVAPRAAPVEQTSFDRHELGTILGLYGRFVAAGLWRDYGISCLRDRAVFSVFHRTAENPAFRIEKIPALRHRQGLYALFGPEGQVLKRGATLSGVLAPLERKLMKALD